MIMEDLLSISPATQWGWLRGYAPAQLVSCHYREGVPPLLSSSGCSFVPEMNNRSGVFSNLKTVILLADTFPSLPQYLYSRTKPIRRCGLTPWPLVFRSTHPALLRIPARVRAIFPVGIIKTAKLCLCDDGWNPLFY